MPEHSFARVREACRNAGISVQQLFDLPFPTIVAFADAHKLAIGELMEVCRAMLDELAALEARMVPRDRSSTN